MAKVLVADDNSNIQKMAATALKELGIEVVGFSNGESAVKKMADVKPDLILADVFMPVRDGYELCDWVKKSEAFSHVPVFLLVGAFDPLDDHKVQAVKADGIIKKPFVPPDRLITIVQAMLERLAHSKHQESLKETHDHFSQNVPHAAEDTQQLSEAEVNAMLKPPAPPEPEPVEYAVRTPQIELGDSNQPAFADMLGDADPNATAGLEAPAEPVPQNYDIQEAPRRPTPDMPPIKVDFSGDSEPMELVRDEPVAMPPSMSQPGRLEELVANPNEWVQPAPPPPPVEASGPVLEAVMPPMPQIRVTPPPPAPPKAEPMGVPSKELHGLDWSQSKAAAASAAPPPASPPSASSPQVIPTAPTVNPHVIDEIVDKVMMQLQPQIIHRITAEVGKAMENLQPRILHQLQTDVVRPLAEELLRNIGKKP